MKTPYTIIAFSDDPDAFLNGVSVFHRKMGTITAAQFVFEDRYQTAIEGERFANLSFCLCVGEEFVALVLAHKLGDALRYNHLGVAIFGPTESKKPLAAVFAHLTTLGKTLGLTSIAIDDRNSGPEVSLIGKEAFNLNACPQAQLEAIVDLSQSEEEIHRGLRKSYKSLVNQGRKEMRFEYLQGTEASEATFDSFRLFHQQVAGRVTRPKESWDVQYEMIQSGDAELVLGYMDGEGLVSSALFCDSGTQTSYAVAVYDREKFDHPLAHANVYEGLIRAKRRGQKEFYLGQIPTFGTVSDKEFNIGKFKKGFCDSLRQYTEWRTPIG